MSIPTYVYRVRAVRLSDGRDMAEAQLVTASDPDEACVMAERAHAGQVSGVDWYFADRVIPMAYALAPIGVDGALEAITPYAFCSADCRTSWLRLGYQFGGTQYAINWELAESVETGHVCELCARAVTGEN